MSLLGTCATPAPLLCLITWACVDEEGLGKEMGIGQSHLAKTRQETKSSNKVAPQPISAAGPGGHKLQKNGLFIKVCCGGSAGALQSELCQGVPWASAGLGLPPVSWPRFLPFLSPPARACCGAVNTHVLVHMKYCDVQVSIPALHTPLQLPNRC